MPFVTAAVCLLYYLMICRYVGRWNSTFSRFWICCGLVSVCYGIAGGWFPTVMIQALSFAWILFWVVILAVWIRMAVFGHRQAAGNLEYLIVLGAKVNGTRITSSLKLRLDRAYTYATANPSVRIVVSGGRGRGEDIPEAKAMADYLVSRGMKRERIFLEDQSSTTEENLRFTAQMLPGLVTRRVGVVTNSFHIYRACLLGKQVGYKRLFSVPAGSEPVLYFNYVVREALAVLMLPLKRYIIRH